MKVKINKEKGIISFNNKEIKLQKIYFKEYTDINKLSKGKEQQTDDNVFKMQKKTSRGIYIFN